MNRICSLFSFSMLLVLLTSLAGCGTKSTLVEPKISGDITEVLERLEKASKANPKPGTTFQFLLTPRNADEEPCWTITATRTTPQGVTEYGMLICRSANRWVCRGATARETESTGAKSEHHLSSESIEIDQLIIWLAW